MDDAAHKIIHVARFDSTLQSLTDESGSLLESQSGSAVPKTMGNKDDPSILISSIFMIYF